MIREMDVENISSDRLIDTEEINKALAGINFGNGSAIDIESVKAQLEEIDRLRQEFADKARRDDLESQKFKLQQDLERIKTVEGNSLAEIRLRTQITDIDTELTEMDIQNSNRRIAQQQREKEAILQANEDIRQSRMELYETSKDLANQLFDNVIENYDREIEASNDHYDALIENAESGSEQEAVLQEQKQKREEELQ